MSRGLKIYAAVIAVLVVALVVTQLYQPPEVRELNTLLKQDKALATYPYPFRVISVENGVALISSPRSVAVPVPVMIKAIDPSLKGVAVTDERYQKAQKQLANHQARAKKLVLNAPEVSRTQWQLDATWLRERGISVPAE